MGPSVEQLAAVSSVPHSMVSFSMSQPAFSLQSVSQLVWVVASFTLPLSSAPQPVYPTVLLLIWMVLMMWVLSVFGSP